jgi:hypothetical protein
MDDGGHEVILPRGCDSERLARTFGERLFGTAHHERAFAVKPDLEQMFATERRVWYGPASKHLFDQEGKG